MNVGAVVGNATGAPVWLAITLVCGCLRAPESAALSPATATAQTEVAASAGSGWQPKILAPGAAEYLPEARWQRCMVHFYRNVFSHVPTTKVREVSHMLKAIHAQESRDAADRKARASP